MPRPRAYSPEPGYRYQILCRNRDGERAWEHCDYAVDRAERSQLLAEHRVAYGTGYKFKTVALPRKYWASSAAEARAKSRRRFAAARPHGLCERADQCVEHERNPRVPACKTRSS